MDRLIRKPELCKILGLSKTTIEKLVRTGSLPSPVKITGYAVAWRQSDISAWIASLPSERGEVENV